MLDLLGAKRSGVGWPDWDCSTTVADNAVKICDGLPDVIVAYKPQDHPSLAESFGTLRTLRVLTFNEMYKEDRTVPEIRQSGAALVICHHYNDWLNYSRKQLGVRIAHIPHCTDLSIF